jgi:hypothetical protein
MFPLFGRSLVFFDLKTGYSLQGEGVFQHMSADEFQGAFLHHAFFCNGIIVLDKLETVLLSGEATGLEVTGIDWAYDAVSIMMIRANRGLIVQRSSYAKRPELPKCARGG